MVTGGMMTSAGGSTAAIEPNDSRARGTARRRLLTSANNRLSAADSFSEITTRASPVGQPATSDPYKPLAQFEFNGWPGAPANERARSEGGAAREQTVEGVAQFLVQSSGNFIF